MPFLSFGQVQQIIGEVNSTDEKQRRQDFRRRGRIYKDGGKDFLIEHLQKEFGKPALDEMRLAPINVLKSWVDRKSIIYARPPIRTTAEQSDKDLMDAYADRMALDLQMQKANRYFNLYSNTELYVIPREKRDGSKCVEIRVTPPWLYGVSTNAMDNTQKDAIVFSSFVNQDESLQRKNIQDVSSIGINKPTQTRPPGQGLNSGGSSIGDTENIPFIFWTDEQHFTVMNGQLLIDENNPEQVNPIGVMPSVTLRKDVDNEYWAMQGEDLVDMAIATQLMYTDQLTIAKQQGFALLTIVSSEQPRKIEVGLQKAVWLKQKEGEPTPSINYVNANAPIAEYSALSDRILEVSSTSNLLPPTLFGSGSSSSGQATSGTQEMIKQAATLMEIESQKPVLRDAELEVWELVKAWHNLLHDKNELPEDLRQLGKFSDGFAPQISYQDMKPIESEEQRLMQAEKLIDMGLATKADALQKLRPELTDDDAREQLEKVEEEKRANAAAFGLPMGAPPVAEEEEESEDGEN